MKFLIIFFFIAFSLASYSQKKGYYIFIPPTLYEGRIIYDIHADVKDSTFTILFTGLRFQNPTGFYFSCDKKFENIDKSSLLDLDVTTPGVIIDSLATFGRAFFRRNTFHVLFIRGDRCYAHKARGESLYKNKYGEVLPSKITFNYNRFPLLCSQ